MWSNPVILLDGDGSNVLGNGEGNHPVASAPMHPDQRVEQLKLPERSPRRSLSRIGRQVTPSRIFAGVHTISRMFIPHHWSAVCPGQGARGDSAEQAGACQ